MNGIEMRVPTADIASINLQSSQAKSADKTEKKTTEEKKIHP